jgi:hypothetical protein
MRTHPWIVIEGEIRLETRTLAEVEVLTMAVYFFQLIQHIPVDDYHNIFDIEPVHTDIY